MIRNCFLVLISITTIFACTTTPRPQFEFSPGTRIGIVSNLENQLTYRHFGSLRFGNFSKKIDVDWDIPANLDKKLSRALEADPRYTVISIKPLKPLSGINRDPDDRPYFIYFGLRQIFQIPRKVEIAQRRLLVLGFTRANVSQRPGFENFNYYVCIGIGVF